MATKARKTTKSTRSKTSSRAKKTTRAAADYTTAQAKAASDYTKTATNAAYDFTNFTKNFANPSQFFNLSALQNFQPANLQSIFEQVIETNQKNWETLTACTQLAVEHAKEAMEEQATFTGKLIQQAASSLQESFTNTSSDPRDKLEEISELTKNYMQKTATQTRKAAEENIEIAQRIGNAISKRFTASVEELRSAA